MQFDWTGINRSPTPAHTHVYTKHQTTTTKQKQFTLTGNLISRKCNSVHCHKHARHLWIFCALPQTCQALVNFNGYQGQTLHIHTYTHHKQKQTNLFKNNQENSRVNARISSTAATWKTIQSIWTLQNHAREITHEAPTTKQDAMKLALLEMLRPLLTICTLLVYLIVGWQVLRSTNYVVT